MINLNEVIKEFDEEYEIEEVILLGRKGGVRRIVFELGGEEYQII